MSLGDLHNCNDIGSSRIGGLILAVKFNRIYAKKKQGVDVRKADLLIFFLIVKLDNLL